MTVNQVATPNETLHRQKRGPCFHSSGMPLPHQRRVHAMEESLTLVVNTLAGGVRTAASTLTTRAVAV